MSQQIRTLQTLKQIRYTPGAVETIELPRGSGDIESIFLDLAGTFTYPAGAAGSLTTLKAQTLVQRIEVVVDGKITVLSVPGWAFGVFSDRTFDGSGGGAFNSMTNPAANANGTLAPQFYVDFMQFDGFKPSESNLRVRNASIVELKITFAPWSACFTNAASVPTVFNVNVYVEANFRTEIEPEKTKPAFLIRRMSQVIDADSSNTSRQIRLPSGNIIRSVKLFTHVAGVGSNAILQTVEAANGLDTRVKTTERGLTTRLRGYREPQLGMYEIDFARVTRDNVMFSNAWAVPGFAEPVLTLGYEGGVGRKIELVTTEYVRV
jgi:hypothetical protein